MPIKKLLIYLCLCTLCLSCSKKDTGKVQLNLYLNGPLTNAQDAKMPKEVVNLLAPRVCGEANTFVNLTVYRYDFEPVQSENIKIPLSRANEVRKKFGFLAFEHYAMDFKSNANDFSNSAILSKESEGNTDAGLGSILSSADLTFLCCGFFSEESTAAQRMQNDYDLLLQELNDSLCSKSTDRTFNFIYNVAPAVLPESIPNNGQSDGSSIAMVFDQIGNADVDPNERLNTVPEVLELFSDNAAIIVEETNGTAFAPSPVVDYLEKIALFRSLEQIEILETKMNDAGLCFEVRLIEHHKGMIQ